MGLVVARQATEPALGVDFVDTSRAAIEAGDLLQIIERVVDEVVFLGANEGVITIAAEGRTDDEARALADMRPLVGRDGECFCMQVGLVSGDEDTGGVRNFVALRVDVGREVETNDGGAGELDGLEGIGSLGGDLG